ncbi:MAG: AtzE family amidohydrolase [Rhodocyclaceae bacterium]|nr:AtzE family amidohydrolase [Rhodocyclaceae bacterium]
MTTHPSATDFARQVARGDVSARELATAALAQIERDNPHINAYTAVTAERALAEADHIDALRRQGEVLPPLAGVPYAVKNLFDVAGITTLAGARLYAANAPASQDATLVARMKSAGAVLTGALNMDAYAYGFTTENTHYGVTRNPLDPQRVAGGSSGGCGAAIAAGMVPCSLGSDTNGSIRVPSSFCGIYGLKPSFGRLPRSGSLPFVPNLDHLGPFARSAEDLALIYDALQGPDARDPACAQRACEATLPDLTRGIEGLRVAVLGGHFTRWAGTEARAAVATAARVLEAKDEVELVDTAAARAAAFIITAAEAGNAYLPQLRERPEDFEPLTRERLSAGALLPAAWYVQAQRLRARYRARAAELFRHHDILLAAATPCPATRIGQETMDINGTEVPVRPNIGLLTQPLSFIGLPIAVVPLATACGLPIGVQLIAPAWREDLCLRAAWALEQGLVRA